VCKKSTVCSRSCKKEARHQKKPRINRSRAPNGFTAFHLTSGCRRLARIQQRRNQIFVLLRITVVCISNE
jgi:hypothetical protein